ncbi:11-beta-hydroxysteroid dehydrogenase-like 2 [Quercus lobata]|uniref:11-beta-hydroxysteroid dehydrogenase-like 2 n=1 Tax=Quercus lobata TaxID=97700 RepID=UPI001247BDFE|nr:11-beta-hydroxysteroid dehydrogenase-like 2 [Quercus lobata]
MDLLHNLLNTMLLPLTLTVLFLFTPPFLFLKFLWSLKRSIYFDNATDKVILITGASSGIGEHVAYEYAKRGARLALVARREDCLRVVANKACKLGSPEVIVLRANVSKVEECKRFVDEAVSHFGQLDHLVNNAGILHLRLFEDFSQLSDIASIMDINFWGSVYSTHYAVPHLRKSKGKIVVIASTEAWLSTPRFSFYNASKAALISFFETLRTELGQDIGITIVNPGVIESEMTRSDYLSEGGFRKNNKTEGCAKAILDSTCNGDMYLTEPSWMKVGFWVKTLCPEVFE